MLKRILSCTAVTAALMAIGLAGPAPAATAVIGHSSTVAAEASRPALKPPKSTPFDRTISRPTWRADNHVPPPAPGAPSVRSTSREYGIGSQAITNTGLSATVYMGNPHVVFADGATGHSLVHEVTYETTGSHAGYYCSDVGNGHDGSAGAGSAYFSSALFAGQMSSAVNLFVYTNPGSPLYGRLSVAAFSGSTRSFYSGGPGSNSTNTAKGTNGAC